MSAPAVLWERRGPVGIAALNRPAALNALTVEALAGLERCVEEVEGDPSLRVLVVTGSGEKAFCVGADLKALAAEYGGDTPPAELTAAIHGAFGRLEACPRPVVAAIRGYCLGGGLELALAADLRVAAEDARFGLPEARIGSIPGGGGTQRLPRLIGLARAKELMLTGEQIDAAEAHRIGLVNRVFPATSLVDDAVALAAAMARLAPLALQRIKEAANGSVDLPLEQGLELERACHDSLWTSEDRREGIRAFLEKRDPVFRGR